MSSLTTKKLTMKMARAGYEAYCEYMNWTSSTTGGKLSKWELAPNSVVNAWFAVATTMINFLVDIKSIEDVIKGEG